MAKKTKQFLVFVVRRWQTDKSYSVFTIHADWSNLCKIRTTSLQDIASGCLGNFLQPSLNCAIDFTSPQCIFNLEGSVLQRRIGGFNLQRNFLISVFLIWSCHMFCVGSWWWIQNAISTAAESVEQKLDLHNHRKRWKLHACNLKIFMMFFYLWVNISGFLSWECLRDPPRRPTSGYLTCSSFLCRGKFNNSIHDKMLLQIKLQPNIQIFAHWHDKLIENNKCISSIQIMQVFQDTRCAGGI